ncbi:ABC transporter permease [Candidatus Peregrinibacteria bacterium]|nr:ABC transporter permease [Candidatus Peregrinibacteria bacterium]
MKIFNNLFHKKHKESVFEMTGRALDLSFSNMWRNKYLTIATVLVMGILIFIFNIMLAVNYVAKSALDELTQKVDIVVYLKDSSEYYQVQEMINDLKKLEGVTGVSYRSKTEALEIVSKTHPKTAEFLERYGVENPLPPSINVTTEKPELHIAVQQFLNQEKYRHMLANIVSDAEKQSSATEVVTKNLINLSNATNQIIFWVFVIFITGSILIISNAIQLTIYSRQKEIYIMRLVGATKNFIRLPFLFEGMFYGMFAMIVAFLLIIIMATQIQIAQISIVQYLNKIPLAAVFMLELGASIVIGIICSFIAVYRYLRSKLILE